MEKPYKEELHNLYALNNTLRATKPQIVRRVGQGACMGEKTCKFRLKI
jgi:hypothetical protein